MARRRQRHEIIERVTVVEQAAHHHFPIPPPRGEHIKIVCRNAPRGQMFTCDAVLRDLSSRRYVVRGHVVAENQERVSLIRSQAIRLISRCKRRAADVGRRDVPWELRRIRCDEVCPRRVLAGIVKRFPIVGAVRVCSEDSVDLRTIRPEVTQIDLAAVIALSHRIARNIAHHIACERIGNDHRRRGKKSILQVWVNAAWKVAVAREHGDGVKAARYCCLHLGRKRAGIANASRASKADDAEADSLEILK